MKMYLSLYGFFGCFIFQRFLFFVFFCYIKFLFAFGFFFEILFGFIFAAKCLFDFNFILSQILGLLLFFLFVFFKGTWCFFFHFAIVCSAYKKGCRFKRRKINCRSRLKKKWGCFECILDLFRISLEYLRFCFFLLLLLLRVFVFFIVLYLHFYCCCLFFVLSSLQVSGNKE